MLEDLREGGWVRRFGWMRLAYLFLALTALAALARLGGPDAEAIPLSALGPDSSKPSPGEVEPPPAPTLTDEVISHLEDARGSAGSPNVGPNIVEPRVPATRAPEEAEKRTSGERGPADEGPQAAETEPPVFYRPPDAGAAPEAAPGAGPVCGDLSGAPKDGKVVFPLAERFYYSYEDTWGAPRTQGGHEGTDLMTPSGVPEYAITDGTVVPVAGSNADGWNTLGGYAVMVRADYSIGPVKRGDLFYYAHLEREGALPIGARVRAGQVVGYAGDTGQGPQGTRGLFPPHLHLGWYDTGGTREEADSGAMNPYPLLEWIKANGGAVTGDSDTRFCEAPRPAPPIPSGNDDGPANPGISPDLDTGSDDPKPSQPRAEARKERPKPNPTTEKNTRRQRSPAEKPDRRNHPEKRPQKDPKNPPAEKPENHDQPEPAEPRKPARPDPEPTKQQQPPPDHDVSRTPRPTEPSGDQYDDAGGAALAPPAATSEPRGDEPTPGRPQKEPPAARAPNKTGPPHPQPAP